MTTSELMEIIKAKHSEHYNAFGIRSVYDKRFGRYEVGDSLPDSYEWDFDNDCSTYHTTGETLNGASAVAVETDDLWLDGDDDDELAARIEKALKASKSYDFGETMLVGGKNGSKYGHDEGEIVIESAVVLAVIE